MPSKPVPDKGSICPFHQKDVSKVCPTCPLYISVRGRDSNKGIEIDEWGCSFGFLPVLLIEVARQGRSAAAATENLTSEVVKRQAPDMSQVLGVLAQGRESKRLIGQS